MPELNAKRTYLDHAATTPVDPRVLAAMTPYFSESFGNPGSMHKEGAAAKLAVLTSRAAIAKFLSASVDEIIFTGSGTEANNLAILGFAERVLLKASDARAAGDGKTPRPHFITSVIEHPSVLNCFKALEGKGARVSYVPVTKDGILDLDAFQKELCEETALVSIMLANNEIGTIQPISEIAKIIARKQKEAFFFQSPVSSFQHPVSSLQFPAFHCDASQAPLYLPLDVKKLGADMLTLDAQKIYGPKGIGLLYRARNVELSPILYGGSQEFGMHPGTENVPGIVGFAEALAVAGELREKESARLSELRDYGIAKILLAAPGAELNGSQERRLPSNINISFPGHDSEWLVLQLDARGISVGARSACSSAKAPGSEVVAALGKRAEHAASSLRISFGRATEKEDIDRLAEALEELLDKKK